jgi:2Fe-2S ferredoxin
MKILVTLPTGARVQCAARATWSLKDVIRDAGVEIIAQCGGGCACATCHAHIGADWNAKLASPTIDEIELLETSDTYVPGRSRLTCQIICDGSMDGLELTLQPDSWEE